MSHLAAAVLVEISNYLTYKMDQVKIGLRELSEEKRTISSDQDGAIELGTLSWESDAVASKEAAITSLSMLKDNIEKALSRVKTGTYGHCQKCGGEIEPARLLAIPTASDCSPCKTSSES